MKCPTCVSCFEHPIINNERYLYCWLCKKYYYWDGKELKDVTDQLTNTPSQERQQSQ
jgi:hypothetical protein